MKQNAADQAGKRIGAFWRREMGEKKWGKAEEGLKRGDWYRLAAVFLLSALLVLLLGGAVGCTGEEEPEDKVADLEFSVVPDEEIPEELKRLIEEKKANEFKLSYSADGSLYIAAGYGTKATGGYSVTIKALYLTENAIVMDSDLMGPGQEEEVSQAPSWPYIVIRMEDRTESIVFR